MGWYFLLRVSEITYSIFYENFEVIKEYYEGLLSPFFDRERIMILKEKIYSLKISTLKKDTMWELLNGDLDVEDIKNKSD